MGRGSKAYKRRRGEVLEERLAPGLERAQLELELQAPGELAARPAVTSIWRGFD